MRILFNPNPGEGGDGTKTSPTSTPSPPPTMIPLTPEEYQRLRTLERDYGELQRNRQAELDTKEQARLKAMADKEGAEKALEEQRRSWEGQVSTVRQQYSALEQRWLGEHRNGVIVSALAGLNFSGANDDVKRIQAAQLKAILEPLLESTLDASGSPITREKSTGRPAADFLKEQLASPAFAHFFKPGSLGGSGTDGTRSQGGSGGIYADNPNPPGSVEWHAFNLKRQNEQYPSMGLVPRRGK